MKFIPFDANYFGKGSTNKDCVIRALCSSAMTGYVALCDYFGKGDEFIMGSGYGVKEGIGLDELNKFAKKTGILKLVWGDENYSKMLDLYGVSDDDTLENFIKNDIDEIVEHNKLKLPRFVVCVRDEGEGEHHFHATSLVFHKGEWCVLDVPTIKNIKDSVPIYVYAVMKMPDKNSPIYYDNERRRIEKEQAEYLANIKKNEKSATKKLTRKSRKSKQKPSRNVKK